MWDFYSRKQENMNTDYLEALKSNGRWTYQQLSEVSGVPSSTISRLFSGHMIGMDSAAAIMQVMGGSLDELMGMQSASSAGEASTNEIQIYQTALQHNRETLTYLRRWVRRFFIAFCVAVGLTIFILVAILFDCLHPEVGWIKS